MSRSDIERYIKRIKRLDDLEETGPDSYVESNVPTVLAYDPSKGKTVSATLSPFVEEIKKGGEKRVKKSLKQRWNRIYPIGEDEDDNYAQNLTYDDIKDAYKDMVAFYLKNKKKKLTGVEAKESARLNKLINTLRESGVIEDEGGKLKNVNTKRMSDWDTHFNVADKVYGKKAEGAREGLDILQRFAEDYDIDIKASSVHRGKDHKLSKKAKAAGYTSDHEHGRAIDVSRLKVLDLSGQEKELDYQGLVGVRPDLYKELTKRMNDAGFYYINEKIGKFNHGHFAYKPKGHAKHKKRAQRIQLPNEKFTILSEDNEFYRPGPEDVKEGESSDQLTLAERFELQRKLGY